jgi:hypothetical protein
LNHGSNPDPEIPEIPVPPRPDLAGKIAGIFPIPIGLEPRRIPPHFKFNPGRRGGSSVPSGPRPLPAPAPSRRHGRGFRWPLGSRGQRPPCSLRVPSGVIVPLLGLWVVDLSPGQVPGQLAARGPTRTRTRRRRAGMASLAHRGVTDSDTASPIHIQARGIPHWHCPGHGPRPQPPTVDTASEPLW